MFSDISSQDDDAKSGLLDMQRPPWSYITWGRE